MTRMFFLAVLLILASIHPHAAVSHLKREAAARKPKYTNRQQHTLMVPPEKAADRNPGKNRQRLANVVQRGALPDASPGTESKMTGTNKSLGMMDQDRAVFPNGMKRDGMSGGDRWMDRRKKLSLIPIPSKPNSTSVSIRRRISHIAGRRVAWPDHGRRTRRDDVVGLGPFPGSIPDSLPSLLPPLKTTTTQGRPLTRASPDTAKPRSAAAVTVAPIEGAGQNDILPDKDPNDIAPEPWPEPGPDWSSAYMYLGVAWFIHIYGFACLMLLIAVIAMFVLIEIFATKTVIQRGLSTSLNCLLFLFGLSRGVSLLVNPYGSLDRLSLLASRLAWSVGFPCLTSMLTTLLLVLVDTTKVSLGPPRFQQFHIVIKLSATHFIVVLGTDIILSFYLQLRALLLVCQLVYIIWSILLTVGYFRVGYLIARNFGASRHSTTVHDRAAQRLEKLIFGCGLVALCNCITHLYGAAGVFGVYSDLTFVPAWPWFVFQTLMRIEEIAMCFIVLALAGKSKHDRKDEDGKKSLWCRCLRKVETYSPCFPLRKRNSQEELTNEDGIREDGNVGESWSTYGTNAPESNSKSDSRKGSAESSRDKRSRNSLESIDSNMIDEGTSATVPESRRGSGTSAREHKTSHGRRVSSHSIDGKGKPRKVSLKTVAEETPSTSAISHDRHNVQMISKPRRKSSQHSENDGRNLETLKRKTLYPSLEDSDLQIATVHLESPRDDIPYSAVRPLRNSREERSPQTAPSDTAVKKSNSLTAKKRPAPHPPKVVEKRTIHPSTEDRNLSTLSRPPVRPRPKVSKRREPVISSISTTRRPTPLPMPQDPVLYIDEER